MHDAMLMLSLELKHFVKFNRTPSATKSISGELRLTGNALGFVFAALSDTEATSLRLEML